MRRERALLLAALVSALACSSPQPPTVAAQPGEPPSFDGRVVHPIANDTLRGAYYEAAIVQRRDVAPTLPPDTLLTRRTRSANPGSFESSVRTLAVQAAR